MEVPEIIDCFFLCFHCKESGESMEIWQCLKRLAGVWHFMMFWDCRVFDREMASSWQFRVWSSGYSCWWSTDIWPQLPSGRYLDDDHRSSEFLWLSWLWRSWFMMTLAMLMMIYMMVMGQKTCIHLPPEVQLKPLAVGATPMVSLSQESSLLWSSWSSLSLSWSSSPS